MKEKKNNNIFVDIDMLTGDYGSTSHSTSWVEESFQFSTTAGKQVALPNTSQHIGISFSQKKSSLFLWFLATMFFFLLAWIVHVQLVQGSSYLSAAESNRKRTLPIPSERGYILDRNGIKLTENIPNFSLALVPQDLPRDVIRREQVIRRLSELTSQNTTEIRAVLERYGNYSYESIVIQEGLDYETALLIQIAAADLPGIHIQRGSKRLYLTDFPDTGVTSSTLSLSHIIGYQGKLSPEELDVEYENGYLPSDLIGKTGVEKTYERALRGTYGRREIEVNARGREQSVLSEKSPEPGKHVVLAIDIRMQQKLEQIVKHYLNTGGKKRAAAVVLDVHSGQVLALVSVPAYDNNHFSGGISVDQYRAYLNNEDKPLFNRAISGTYPSGSTIKPAVAAAALQEGIINASTSFLSSGGVAVSQWFFPDWLSGGHGITNVRKSLADSVNTFYYYIGGGYRDFTGLGVDMITAYLRSFGFAKELGIDLNGEQAGFLPSKKWKQEVKNERWYIGDTYNLSIGQGDILVTPLQIASMTASIANGGTLYQPHVVKGIIHSGSEKEEKIKKKIIGENIILQKYLRTVRLGMRDCVVYGSCRRLSLLPFSAAGKTGTAQWHAAKENHAWFTSFAPFEDPKIAVTVLVEEGEGGSKIAAPIAYDFYKWWGNYR